MATLPSGKKLFLYECMRRRDIIGAIAQCINATRGVNLTEQASYHYLAQDLFNPDYGKVIYINELNEFMTTKDAIKYLKEHGKKEA